MKRKAKPKWIRSKLPTKGDYGKIRRILGDNSLHTVCEEAFCPNCTECWESGTATFLLMGDICTRGCKFCDVKTGNPRRFLDREEPEKLAKAVNELNLKYVVLTSVDRDDLDDGGADHLVSCIKKIKEKCPEVLIEILIPDFQGNVNSLKKIVEAKPTVIGHNIETTKVLTPKVRDKRASYQQSIVVLRNLKNMDSRVITKSSIMLGLGETNDQIIKTLHDLKEASVDVVTIGQYLQPSRRNLEVVNFIEPQQFKEWEKVAIAMGFRFAVAGPLVRSSYRAGELFIENYVKKSI